MNTVAAAFLLLAAQAMASYPVAPVSSSSSAEAEAVTSSAPSSSEAATHSTHVPSSSSSAVAVTDITSPVTAVVPATTSSAAPAPAPLTNGTHPVWSYFNVTVTSVVVVQELTTLCEEATTLTFNDCEYPATKGEVVVVTNCPCTVTTAIPTLSSTISPPGVTAPAVPPPPPTHAVPSATQTAAPTYPVNPPIQVGGAVSPAGNGNTLGLVVAAVAVVLGF